MTTLHTTRVIKRHLGGITLNQFSQIQQITQLAQQLTQQTQQASMQYQQLLRQEQSNAEQLNQIAQRE